MKEISFKNSRGLNLKGTLFNIESEDVIIFSHGWISNRKSKGRFEPLAKELRHIQINN